jgi:hypothetical protein
MLVEFNCPNCGKTHRAADKYSGRRVQCRTCNAILQVPGLPPIHEPDKRFEEEDSEPVETPASDEDGLPAPRLQLQGSFTTTEADPDQAPANDSSYGIASLYLAAFSFILFFTPAVIASMTSIIGASIAFFAGALTTGGCFLFCRHGLRLAEQAEGQAAGQGYVIAAKLVNKFFLKFYALAIVFFLGVGIYVLVRVKQTTGFGLVEVLKIVEQVKGGQ